MIDGSADSRAIISGEERKKENPCMRGIENNFENFLVLVHNWCHILGTMKVDLIRGTGTESGSRLCDTKEMIL